MKPFSKKQSLVTLLGIGLLLLSFSTKLVHSNSANPDMQTKQIVKVIVNSKNDIKIDGKSTSLEQLQNDVKARISTKAENTIISLAIQKSVKMSTVSEIRNQLQEIQVYGINYSTNAEQDSELEILPKGIKQFAARYPDKNRLEILMNNHGDMIIDQQPFKHLKATKYIKQRIENNLDIIIDITTHPQTSFDDYLAIIQKVKTLGAKRITTGGQMKRPPINQEK